MMASKPVEFHEEAAVEYEAAFDWYFERSRLAASTFADELNQALDRIVAAPDRWPKFILDTRKVLLDTFLSQLSTGNFRMLSK